MRLGEGATTGVTPSPDLSPCGGEEHGQGYGEANDPSFLEQLLQASYQFTLGDGEKKVQDLRIAGGVL